MHRISTGTVTKVMYSSHRARNIRSCYSAIKKRRVLTAIIFVVTIAYNAYHKLYDSVFLIYPERYRNKYTTEQCIIPYPDPFDQSIMHLFPSIGPLVCAPFPDLIYLDSDGYYNYNQTAIETAGFKGGVLCYYSNIERDGEYNVHLTSPKQFHHHTYISGDSVQVVCRRNNTLVYKQIFHNIDNRSTVSTKQIHNETEEQVSVLIFGIDSLSRLSAYRKLPKTMKYLEEVLNAFVFKGYTKVKENSFPNLHALLTGKFPLMDKEYDGKTIDDEPFIWKEFQSANYVTMFMEDHPFMSIFHSVTKGFVKKPVHHYQRPFAIASHKIEPYFKYSNYKVYFNYYKTLATMPLGLCYGNEPRHHMLINSFKRFLKSYKHKRKFLFSWLTCLAHSDPNNLEFGDADFVRFLQFMKQGDFLQNAILIFMGDHGSLYSQVRNTPIGRIEERMPLFAMVVPEKLKTKYPQMNEILNINTERLVTHFDAHETMVDILKKAYVSPSTRKLALGRSLFKEIPKTRTCKDAWIPNLHCPCYARVPIVKDTVKIQNMARVVIERINTMLSDVKNLCQELKLERIENAELVKSELTIYTKEASFMQRIFRPPETKDEQYFLLVRTHPGDGLFESMALYKSDGSVEITESISRSNRYGNQSHCVSEKRLKPYCYCNNV